MLFRSRAPSPRIRLQGLTVISTQELREYKEYLARREALAMQRQQNASASGYYAAPMSAYPSGYDRNARMNAYGGGGMYGNQGYGYGGGYGCELPVRARLLGPRTDALVPSLSLPCLLHHLPLLNQRSHRLTMRAGFMMSRRRRVRRSAQRNGWCAQVLEQRWLCR